MLFPACKFITLGSGRQMPVGLVTAGHWGDFPSFTMPYFFKSCLMASGVCMVRYFPTLQCYILHFMKKCFRQILPQYPCIIRQMWGSPQGIDTFSSSFCSLLAVGSGRRWCRSVGTSLRSWPTNTGPTGPLRCAPTGRTGTRHQLPVCTWQLPVCTRQLPVCTQLPICIRDIVPRASHVSALCCVEQKVQLSPLNSNQLFQANSFQCTGFFVRGF